jgi:3-isopropylmalate dehydrogenase
MEILVLPGDGIGPEITEATIAATEALNRKFSLGLQLRQRKIGLESLATCGTTLPEDIIRQALSANGVILGPVSSYSYPPREQGGINPSAEIRNRLDLYANIRPCHARSEISPFAANMDLVIVRENTEGFYAARNMVAGSGEFMPSIETAFAIRKVTAVASHRIAVKAFELARQRCRKVTVVHKANVFRLSDGLFLREVRNVADKFPDVDLEEVLVDAMAALLIRQPERFDVILTTNMFGDILSDEAAELCGGLGLAASLNMGDEYAVAQAVHGSAPDIAGQNRANPTALMLSVAMLLDWLNIRHQRTSLSDAAAYLRTAINTVIAEPANRTADLGGCLSTSSFGRIVADKITEMKPFALR